MLRVLLASAFVGVALPAAAQEKAPALAEVERGFSIASEVGAIFLPELPGGHSASGAVLGFSLGVDAGPARVGLVAWGQSLGAEADHRGIEGDRDRRRARGDFQTSMVGLDLRLGLGLGADAQGVERTRLSLRVLGGPTLVRPVGILEDEGLMVAAGPGLEYHTRLRHFALGLDVLGILQKSGDVSALGVAALPVLRYTF